MTKRYKHKIIIISLIILALGVASYFIWKNNTIIKFEGKDKVLNETLITLKEGEFIKSTEIKGKNGYNHYKYSVDDSKIAQLSSFDTVLNENKLTLIEESDTISGQKYKKNYEDRYIYDFNFEKNTFERKVKTKGYEITAFETYNNNYYLAYVQTNKYKREPYIDEDGNDNERLIMNRFSSEISNPNKQKSIILENRYVYFLVYENNKLYAFLGKDYSKKEKFDFSDILWEKPVDIYIYNDELEKIGEIKKDKETFIKEKTYYLKKFRLDSEIKVIEKDAYKIEYKDANYEQRKSGYYTELTQYKEGEIVKSILIEPRIYEISQITPIAYQPKGYLILESNTPSGFIKINVETLEYEDYPIKGLDGANDKTK